MRFLLRATLIAVALAPTGCVSLFHSRSGIRAEPITVERQAEAVFGAYQIPVTERGANYRVESGWFVVQDVWGMDAVQDRVQCGFDREGQPLALGSRVELSVTLKIAYRNGGTRIGLSSTGRTVPDTEDRDSARCRLTDPFTQELLDAVAGEFPGVVPGIDVTDIPREVPSR